MPYFESTKLSNLLWREFLTYLSLTQSGLVVGGSWFFPIGSSLIKFTKLAKDKRFKNVLEMKISVYHIENGQFYSPYKKRKGLYKKRRFVIHLF